MSNIIIIHGTGSSPNGNWFPWLKIELEKLGHDVFVPWFPTPERQSLENWLKTFEEYEQYLNEDSVVVGHSLGVAFLLNVLEKLESPIKAAFFVAGFIGPINNPEFDELNKTFADKQFDWMTIKNNCRKFVVINSDNDPYVSLDKGQELADKLGTGLIVLGGAGHINKEAGYMEFEFLLEKIKSEI
ncbi:MAG: alpha/beta hydrolase [Patescibacteria group bacterium]